MILIILVSLGVLYVALRSAETADRPVDKRADSAEAFDDVRSRKGWRE